MLSVGNAVRYMRLRWANGILTRAKLIGDWARMIDVMAVVTIAVEMVIEDASRNKHLGNQM